MNITTNNKPWSVTIGLIGEGQEIYSGEEGGLALWNTAIAGKKVTVHSKHPNSIFTNAAHYRTHSQLHLNSSFRAHAALKYYEIINTLLDVNFEQTKLLIHNLPKEHYQLFITRDLHKAKITLHQLYQDDTKTVGVVCAGGADHQSLFYQGMNDMNALVRSLNTLTIPNPSTIVERSTIAQLNSKHRGLN
nr:DNA/RNA helicase domain-containing protein [Bacillus cereus]